MKVDILQKVEGEVYLHYTFKNETIDWVEIEFLHFRGIEEILKDKPLLDALVINPRVCGICGHSHLIATAKAIEDINKFKISNKAKLIRDITLSCELVQNHIKWLYLVILPLLYELGFKKVDFLKALSKSAGINKIVAIFGGQYPHTSYAVPGGVVCEPTNLDIVKSLGFLKEVKDFYNSNILSDIKDFKDFIDSKGLLKEIYVFLKNKNLLNIGRAYDRFLYLEKSKKINGLKQIKADTKYIKEMQSSLGYAKNITYKNRFFEVGPIARMIEKRFIKDLHRRYKDSLFTRIAARVYEIGELLKKIENDLKDIDLEEKSYFEFDTKISGFGEGVVEAPRGSLIHRVWAENGKIKRYQIITPTQFNLSNGSKENPSAAQKAILGLDNKKIAELVFRSFDICSVCTTH